MNKKLISFFFFASLIYFLYFYFFLFSLPEIDEKPPIIYFEKDPIEKEDLKKQKIILNDFKGEEKR